MIGMVAPADVPTLVFGPRGGGKEVVAHLLHSESPRRDGPFVPVNCAALPAGLAESELFGHVKGAFTGASLPRRGLFDEASGGTLFLDEIGELPLEMQAKLLRAVEYGEVRRVGSDHPVRVNVHIVAATNRDLRAMVEESRFHADLYDRLATFTIEVPPLREHLDDLAELVPYFVATLPQGQGHPGFSPEAILALHDHDWPGNVRELMHAVLRLLVFTPGRLITAMDVRGELARISPRGASGTITPDRAAKVSDEDLHREFLASGRNVSMTTRQVRLPRSTVQRRLTNLGLRP